MHDTAVSKNNWTKEHIYELSCHFNIEFFGIYTTADFEWKSINHTF